jgi:hypothetical protein
MSSPNNAYQTVELVPINSQEFTLSKGKRVIFELQPDLGFIKGRDCVLQLDILNNSSSSQMSALNNVAGASSVINRIDIFSLNGTHLHTADNYNQFVALDNQYFYDDQSNLTSLEGCGKNVFVKDSTGNVGQEAQDVAANLLSPRKTDGTPVYGFRRNTCPLRLPLFRWFDDERLVPILVLQGLRIEIFLEDPKIALQAVLMQKTDYLNSDATSHQDPIADVTCLGIDAAIADLVIPDCASVRDSALAVGNTVTVTDAAAATHAKTITALAESESGSEISCAATTTTGRVAQSTADLTEGDSKLKVGHACLVTVPAGAALTMGAMDAAAGGNTNVVTTTGTFANVNESKIVVGDTVICDGVAFGNTEQERVVTNAVLTGAPNTSITYTLSGANLVAGTVTKFQRKANSQMRTVKTLAANGNKLDITLMEQGDVSGTKPDLLPVTAADEIKITAKATVKVTVDSVIGAGASLAEVKFKFTSDDRAATVRPTLKIVSVNVPNPQSIAKLPFNYQFTGYDLFVNTLPASSLRHQQDINSVQSKAVCMNSMYVNVNNEQDRIASSYFTGATPTDLNLNSVQYFINNRLYPVQEYNPQPKEERIVNENENVKALRTINREPKNLGDNDGANLEVYTNTYIHSRELARNQYVFDLREAEPQIRTGYSGVRGQNHTINTFVWSKRIINVSNDGMRVIL